jgi:hypothetical protein
MRATRVNAADFDDCIREAQSIIKESRELDRAHELSLERMKEMGHPGALLDIQRLYLKRRNDLAHRLALNAQRAERLDQGLREPQRDDLAKAHAPA